MPRLGVDYETIKCAAVKLLSQGTAPSVQKIREVLGTGSNSTIAAHLKNWRDEYARKTIHHLPVNMPKELISAFEVLWQIAIEHAQNQLAEYKEAVEYERVAALQKEHDAEKSVAEIKQKLVELTLVLEQETANKQKLNIELAVINERLLKQDEVSTTQKNQYEDRLKYVYEEKDILIARCHELQNEIKSLQERLALQTEQHQNSLAQQNALHEQSENRWLKLVDQARHETKETHKKLDNTRDYFGEKIKRLNNDVQNSQQDLHKKNVELNISLEQINQLKQEIKIIERENTKARSIIMKLKAGKIPKNPPVLLLKNIKKIVKS